jgi:4-azaleucine resistance transporter AzlC
MLKTFRKSFPYTVPVLLGYVPLGIAFGLMLQNAGYNVLWALSSSILIYSGTAQFVEVSFLHFQTALYEIIVIIIIMNARMMFYGLSFLERFREAGKRRIYLIFALTDETYALLTAAKTPDGVRDADFMLAVSMMNQSYWVIGSVIGVLFGTFIGVDTAGIDFAMPALFVVLATEQWKTYSSHLPALIGFVSGGSMLAVFGPDRFMIPALALITILLIVFRKRIGDAKGADKPQHIGEKK